MKPVNFDRKLRRLEKKMDVPHFQPGSTKIGWECLTMPERTLFTKIQKIQEEYGENPPDDIMLENIDLFKKGAEILWVRAFDLFRTTINTLALHEEKIGIFIFWTRFIWFFRETMWIIKRNRMEDEKLKEMFGDDLPPDEDPRWKEMDEWMEGLEREKKKEFHREDKELAS